MHARARSIVYIAWLLSIDGNSLNLVGSGRRSARPRQIRILTMATKFRSSTKFSMQCVCMAQFSCGFIFKLVYACNEISKSGRPENSECRCFFARHVAEIEGPNRKNVAHWTPRASPKLSGGVLCGFWEDEQSWSRYHGTLNRGRVNQLACSWLAYQHFLK